MKVKEDNLVDWYIDWLRSNIKLNNIEEYTEITTPFLDRHNDHIQIYVKQNRDTFTLTDDGYTIGDLEISGCKINSERREEILRYIINGFGIKLEKDELIVEASRYNFAQKQHLLIQAIISINDMFMLSQSRVMGIFFEDVETFLEENEIRYTPNVQFLGKSGFSHNIHFVIPASKTSPERFIKAINNPSRENVQNIIFGWNDIKETRKNNPFMYVFANNQVKFVKPEVITALDKYSVKPVLWTERDNYIKELAA